ncbi:MAG: hypothetical protein ABIS03_12580 [Gemmatimonadaceae bacterium]
MTATNSLADHQQPGFAGALVRTGLTVALSDGLFASATGMFIAPYATPFRVFRGVASVLFGKQMLDGGIPAALTGIGMHIGVAFFWSGLFLLALRNSAAFREALAHWPRALVIASVYGVSIWLIMSQIVIPSMLHHGPTIGPKYWVQLVGHIPFVVMPMVLLNRRATAGS